MSSNRNSWVGWVSHPFPNEKTHMNQRENVRDFMTSSRHCTNRLATARCKVGPAKELGFQISIGRPWMLCFRLVTFTQIPNFPMDRIWFLAVVGKKSSIKTCTKSIPTKKNGYICTPVLVNTHHHNSLKTLAKKYNYHVVRKLWLFGSPSNENMEKNHQKIHGSTFKKDPQSTKPWPVQGQVSMLRMRSA